MEKKGINAALAAAPATRPPGFELGDLVKLKGGGPPMVVEATDDKNGTAIVACLWFDLDGQTGRWRGPFRESFKAPLLEAYEEKDSDAKG